MRVNSFKNRIDEEYSRFERYLNKAGVKLTACRTIVFNVAIHTHGHFAAEELVKQCKARQCRVSRATIYRGLRELLEAGIIRETAFGEKHQHYEHIYDEKLHHHARCIRCHDVIEMPCQDSNQPYLPLLEKKGFHVLGHELHFYGLCQKCF